MGKRGHPWVTEDSASGINLATAHSVSLNCPFSSPGNPLSTLGLSVCSHLSPPGPQCFITASSSQRWPEFLTERLHILL